MFTMSYTLHMYSCLNFFRLFFVMLSVYALCSWITPDSVWGDQMYA